MNNIDKQYIDLLKDILENGVEKQTRNGKTLSVFGRSIRYKFKDGKFPLLTTKKMAWKTMVTELLWFLRGDTNIKYLVDNDCHIWDGDAYKNYSTYVIEEWNSGAINELFEDSLIIEESSDGKNISYRKLSQEEFINKIKTDDEFAKTWGKLGPIYGKQWRSWTNYPSDVYVPDTIDQIANLIRDLKTNPDSRRLMVNAWNVGELDQMVLPPCHYGFQVYTRELSHKERSDLKNSSPYKYGKPANGKLIDERLLDSNNVPTRAISLMWNQRSVDTFLGLPFNIASYGLLLEIIAKEVNMVPDELIGNLGDTHLYSNHIEQAKEQIGRDLTYDDRTEMLKEAMGIENYKNAIKELMPFGGGMSEYYEAYKIPNRTREPFELPKLIINDEFWNHDYQTIDGWIKSMEIGDFTLENYQSHPSIKAPLSN
jgi:thymidylate synthase